MNTEVERRRFALSPIILWTSESDDVKQSKRSERAGATRSEIEEFNRTLAEIERRHLEIPHGPLLEFIDEFNKGACYARPHLLAIRSARWKDQLIDRIKPLRDLESVDACIRHLQSCVNPPFDAGILRKMRDRVAERATESGATIRTPITHSSDFRSVVVKGKPYSLSVNQARAYARLYKEIETGTGWLAWATVQTECEIDSKRPEDTFGKNIELIEKDHGRVRLKL